MARSAINRIAVSTIVLLALGALKLVAPMPAIAEEPVSEASTVAAVQIRYKTVAINGVDVAYREAGRENAPVIILLHGFPTSSHMYRNLIPALADRYRVIAPDYPGFGHSGMPERSAFKYTCIAPGSLDTSLGHAAALSDAAWCQA